LNTFKLTYKPYGERAILIEWPSNIDEDILADVLLFKENINLDKVIVEVRAAYASLLVIYDNFIVDSDNEISKLNSIYSSRIYSQQLESRLWKIPVCYDETFGLDLDEISKEKGLTKQEIIQLHSETIYTVYFIGFLPGFLYLGGLDESLHMPRKSSPRLQIIKGAVAIVENQTGVYPSSSPGGWNIIGNSPINFFDVTKDKPCFAKAGDKIQFRSISYKQHSDLTVLVKKDVYQIESEEIYD